MQLSLKLRAFNHLQIVRRTLLQGGAAFLLKGGNAAVMIVTTALIGRMFGASVLGIFSFSTSLAIVLTLFAGIGFPRYTTWRVALYHRKRWMAHIGLFTSSAAVVVFVLSSIVALLGGLTTFWLLGDSPYMLAFVFALGIMPVFSLLQIVCGALAGLSLPIWAQFPEFFLRPTLFLAFLLVFTQVQRAGEPIAELLTLQFVATVGAALVAIALAWYAFGPQGRRGPRRRSLRLVACHMRPASVMMVSSAVLVLYQQIDIIMLGVLANATAVGIYRPASQLAQLIAFATQTITVPLMPVIARYYAEGNHAVLQRVLVLLSRLAVLGTMIVFAVFVVVGEPLIARIFGAEFVGGYPALLILAGSYVISTLSGVVGVFMNMTGHARYVATVSVASLLLNVALLTVAIPLAGLEGAAVAMAISRVSWSVALLVIATRVTGVHISALGRVPFLEKRR